jgi:hypothetical protein
MSAAILLCGCSTVLPRVSPAPQASGDPREASPVPTPTEVPGTVPRCGAADIAVGPVSWQGATGTMAGGFALFDTGTDPCSIGGRVGVELRDASGVTLAIQVRQLPGVALPVILLPNLGTPRPADGPVLGRASVSIYWSNWCGPGFSGAGTLSASIPDAGVFEAPFAQLSAPRCDDPSSPSVIDVDPIVAQDPGE